MPKPGDTGITRIIRATGYSRQGLAATWRHESAFRQECTAALILTPIAFLLGQTPLQIAALIAVLILVLIVELLNSAIEAVVDRIGDDIHELSGRAKDQGSAAVFLSLCLVILVWTGIAAHNYLPV